MRWPPVILSLTIFLLILTVGCLGGPDDGGDADDVGPSSTESNLTRLTDRGDGTDLEDYPRCQHPWPCGDGSEWPMRLANADHPRQPPMLPSSNLSIEDGKVLAENASAIIYRFTGSPARPTVYGGGATSSVHSTVFDVPSGLYLDLVATLSWSGEDPAPPSGDLAMEMDILDEEGEVACEAAHGIRLDTDGYHGADRSARCHVDHIKPRSDLVQWTVRVETRHNVDAAETFEADVRMEVTEPRRTFPLRSVENVTLESFDGTRLHGVRWMPDVPDGVEVPVVIESTPYAEQVHPPANRAAYLDSRDDSGYILADLLENGYAVAIFNVRGTGRSDGCFDFWGPAEQRDQAELVRWAADRPWSNGRVAMYGLSYMGTTPWEAAIQNPPALKTIVASGILSHLYWAGFTPQGAAWSLDGGPYATAVGSAIGVGPPATGMRHDPSMARAWVEDEACPSSLEAVSSLERGTLTDRRDARWVEDRALIEGFPDITASVLYTAGYHDGNVHQFADDPVWHTLHHGPKRFVTGHWGHVFPTHHTEGSAGGNNFRAQQLAWFDFWLKGLGSPADLAIGTVDYETDDGTWHRSTDWPPAEAVSEVLFLNRGQLDPEEGGPDETFASAPAPASSTLAGCNGAVGPPGEASSLRRSYLTDAVEEPVQMAGNPLTYLNISSNLPGGIVTVDLYRVPADAGLCTDPSTPGERIAHGAADLRHHDGALAPKPFPVDEPEPVRIDMWSAGAKLEPGDRLGLVVHHGDPSEHDGHAYPARLTLHGGDGPTASHLLVPIVEGSLGGKAATLDYPPRPLLPPEVAS